MQRGKKRARGDRSELYEVLDAALLCHLGITIDGAPRVVPTGFGRIGDVLYVHGSSGARHLREAADGGEVCATVTLLDGIVYSRASFHHSANYRSAMIHGRARAVADEDEKWAALRAVTEHLAPGSWDHARQPNRRELAATAVVALPLDEAAVKVRTGGPGDDEDDIATSRAWAGSLPLHRTWGEPRPSTDLAGGIAVPEHVTARRVR